MGGQQIGRKRLTAGDGKLENGQVWVKATGAKRSYVKCGMSALHTASQASWHECTSQVSWHECTSHSFTSVVA